MFRSYKLNIDSLLQEGKNELIILFESPIKKVESSYDSLTYRLPADNDRNEKQTSVFTRKAPYHYGWDWSPRYVTMGIWRPASIQLWDNYKIQDNRIHQFDISDEKAM